MKYKVIKCSGRLLVKVGDILTLSQAAQLMECNAEQMKLRSGMASSVEDDEFKFEILREGEEWKGE